MTIIVNGNTYYPSKILKVGRIEDGGLFYTFEFFMLLGDRAVVETTRSVGNVDESLKYLELERQSLLDIQDGQVINFDYKFFKK